MTTQFNYCPSCGQSATPGTRFCGSCGFDMAATSAPTAVSRPDRTVEEEVEHLLKLHLSKDYDIKGLLGRGGMAIVYQAHEKELERDVAIKVLPPDMAFGSGTVERFKREARTAANLNHPNIIPIYRIGELGRTVFFVMKHIRGRGLDDLLAEYGRFDPNVTVSILKQVCSALSYAHKRGVIHRDIKPSNIMVDDDGWAHVMDFGIAKATGSSTLTATGAAIGTPQYMSPEQCSGKDITPLSDQYSLAIMTYQMLAGELPFQGETVPEILSKHFFEAPPRIRTKVADCPIGIGDALDKALSKKGPDRFATLDEFVKAIEVGIKDVESARSKIGKMATKLGPAIAMPLNPSPLPLSKDAATTPMPQPSTRPSAPTTPMPTPASLAPTTPAAPPIRQSSPQTPSTPMPHTSPGVGTAAPAKSRKGLIAAASIVVVLGASGAIALTQLGSSDDQPVQPPEQLAMGPADSAANPVTLSADSTPADTSGSDSTARDNSTPVPAEAQAAPQQPAATTPVPPQTRLTISDVPANATVRLDGTRITGITRRDVSPGSHHIRVELNGFESYETTITISRGESMSVPIPALRREQQQQPAAANPTPPQVAQSSLPPYCRISEAQARQAMTPGKFAIVVTNCVEGLELYLVRDKAEGFLFDVPSNGMISRILLNATGFQQQQIRRVQVTEGQVLVYDGALAPQ